MINASCISFEWHRRIQTLLHKMHKTLLMLVIEAKSSIPAVKGGTRCTSEPKHSCCNKPMHLAVAYKPTYSLRSLSPSLCVHCWAGGRLSPARIPVHSCGVWGSSAPSTVNVQNKYSWLPRFERACAEDAINLTGRRVFRDARDQQRTHAPEWGALRWVGGGVHLHLFATMLL